MATKAPAKLVLELDFAKATPGTMQYKEPPGPNGARPAMGTMYLTKESMKAFEPNPTRKMRVTIEAIG
jgi:hypothetical protein